MVRTEKEIQAKIDELKSKLCAEEDKVHRWANIRMIDALTWALGRITAL